MQSHALDAPAARAGSLLRAGILVAPLMALGNGLNYVYNIVMARLLARPATAPSARCSRSP